MTPLFTNQMGMIPRYEIPCSCSKPNRNDLTTYERNSDSNFVVVAKNRFLISHNNLSNGWDVWLRVL